MPRAVLPEASNFAESVDEQVGGMCPHLAPAMNLRRGDLPRGTVGETDPKYVRTPADAGPQAARTEFVHPTADPCVAA
jgi:hypothetical protein